MTLSLLMSRTPFIVGALATSLSAFATAAVAEVASAPARASIIDPPGVAVNWALAMPSVRGIAAGASFQGTLPSISLGMMMPGNAALLVRREDQAGLPVTAPASFEVSAQDDQGLTLRTGGADLTHDRPGTLVGGALLDRAAASIEVGKGLALASHGPRSAAQPGFLMVVVQYN
ncbi:hypothetical protein [uncultured Phenylobacterium sp.]|uniref:hypothetical protein n=1 Tax=uncultured Phenylobacterium sp. TaxID=349273 RepID=UPI0025DB16B8|nr:hypothetical protein [uncultured Phenylobacterium sp.]